MTIKIAIDAMGGDNAPLCIVDAINMILGDYHGIEFLVFGREDIVRPLLDKKISKKRLEKVTFFPCEDVVSDTINPAATLRMPHNTSMHMAIDAVKNKEADAVISSGNTGAYMVLSRKILKNIDGIKRPAIASILPTIKGESVALDLGANVDSTPEMLLQFALMGEAYAQAVFNKKNPKVALLNVGKEKSKGNKLVKEAAEIIQEEVINYVGFVEGDDILKGAVDVVVSDGFAMNVAIKSMEGLSKRVKSAIESAFKRGIYSTLAYIFTYPIFRKIRNDLDTRKYNGAILLGLNGIAVKSHGSSDKKAFYHAIINTSKMVSGDLNNKVKEHFLCHE